MAFVAIQIFTILFQILGVRALPEQPDPFWNIEQQWVQQGDQFVLKASSATVPQYCRQHRQEVLIFPQIIHSAQVLRLDGKIVETLGKMDHSASDPFYQQMVIACDKLFDGNSVSWDVQSYSFFFSRMDRYPYFQQGELMPNFLNVTANYLAFAVLLVLSIFTFIIFKDRVANTLTYSVSVGSILLSIYFAVSSNLLVGTHISMILAHKLADISLWAGIFLFYRAFSIEDFSSKSCDWVVNVSCGLGILFIMFAENGDLVQLGTMIPMLPVSLSFSFIVFQVANQARKTGITNDLISKFCSVFCFLVFGLNDIFHVMGVIHTGMTLNLGIIGCILGLSISVAKRIDSTYIERDELRTELEAWAPPFILKAIKHEKIKFPIKKNLAAINYDIINSSKFHDVFIGEKPIRAVVLQAFSEIILKNGGWRESHSGDSAYAHFGILQNEVSAHLLAYRSALEFKSFLNELNEKHSVNLHCGIGLHIADDVLVNVHSVELTIDKEIVQQKSFDTTSTDIDLVHRIESMIHLLPGTNIAMSKKFAEVMNFKIEGLVQLGTFKLKGQKIPTTIFVIPNLSVTQQDLDVLAKQAV